MIRITQPHGISVVIIADDSETPCILELGQVIDTVAFQILMILKRQCITGTGNMLFFIQSFVASFVDVLSIQ
jgi:hypothetical protein